MIRSKTILSALLCSVSFISLAGAAPSAVTDWHVAPVLSPGQNNMPYCALATSYPDAGVIVTHARNKHGTGTIALDFQEGAFEKGQYYGVDISFDNMTRSFAAEARNARLLVIDMAEDHPLYGALNAGQDLNIAVQNGGPQALLAGNSRPFFQLNYCVQALNDDAAADVIVQNPRVMPSFGLQQPAYRPVQDTRRTETIVLRPPQPKKVESVAAPTAAVIQTAQAAATQDGDESRALKSMLDKARKDMPAQTTEKPARQKLSGISSTDDIDPNSVSPVNRNARQSLLFDDPVAANSYVPPRLGDMETQITDKTQQAKAKTQKASAKVEAALEQKANQAQSAQKTAIKNIETQATAKINAAPVASSAVTKSVAVPPAPIAAATSSAALPVALPLPDDTDAPASAVAKNSVKPIEVRESARTVLATDYLAEKATGIPAKPYTPDAVKAAAPVVAASPAITWDKPAAEAEKTMAAPVKSVSMPVVAATTTTNAPTRDTDSMTTPAGSIFSGRPAAIRSSASVATPASLATPAVTPTVEVTPPVIATPQKIEKAAQAAPVAKTAAKLDPQDTLARASTPVKAASVAPAPALPPAVIAAPALPPAIIADEPIALPTRGPSRPAADVVAVTFPEDEIEDISGDVGPASTWSAEIAQNKPLAVPGALLQSKPTGATNFAPPPSPAVGAWSVSKAGDTESGAYCVMKNRFNNQQNVFISRGSDGSATLGVDYGMDLLRLNRDYKATVHVDHLFTEDFVGQARQTNLLVLQMGRKDSFFDALRQGKALHVALDGGASTFDIAALRDVVPAFNTCMIDQGGTGLSAAPVVTAVAAAAPVVAKTVTAPASSSTVTSAPAVTSSSTLPAPRREADIKAAVGLAHMTSTPTQTTRSAPVIAAPAQNAPVAKQAVAAPAMSLSPVKINQTLQQASIRGTARAAGGGYAWGQSGDLVTGQVDEKLFAAGKEDLLEGAMRDIDSREKECGSSFTSEIGIPEQYGSVEILAAETACSRNGTKIAEATLYQRIGRVFRIWTQRSAESDRDTLISQRDRLASALQKD